MIIDATDQILGRVATRAAKAGLLGEQVDVVNCDKAVVSGTRETVLANYKRRFNLGTFKGPFYYRSPDRFVRRTIRGMLPFRGDRGKQAYRKIMCWNGLPETFKGKEVTPLKGAGKEKLPTGKCVTIKEICRNLGGKE